MAKEYQRRMILGMGKAPETRGITVPEGFETDMQEIQRLEKIPAARKQLVQTYQSTLDKLPNGQYPEFRGAVLNDLGIVLAEMREYGLAREKFDEALEIYRELARSQPEIYAPDVAMTLNNLENVRLKMQGGVRGAAEKFEVLRAVNITPPQPWPKPRDLPKNRANEEK